MRVFVSISQGGPVERAIKVTCEHVGHTVVDDPDQAELIVTDSIGGAQFSLDRNKNCKVLFALIGTRDPESAQSLKRTHADRVELKEEGDIVPHLMASRRTGD